MQSSPINSAFPRRANFGSPSKTVSTRKPLLHWYFWWYGNIPVYYKVLTTRAEVSNVDPHSLLCFWRWRGLFSHVELMQLNQQKLKLCPFLPVETWWKKAATLNQRVQIQGGAPARNQKVVYRYFDNLSFYHSTGPEISWWGLSEFPHMVFEGKVNLHLLPNRQAQAATVCYKKRRLNTSFAVLLSEKIQSVLSLGA